MRVFGRFHARTLGGRGPSVRAVHAPPGSAGLPPENDRRPARNRDAAERGRHFRRWRPPRNILAFAGERRGGQGPLIRRQRWTNAPPRPPLVLGCGRRRGERIPSFGPLVSGSVAVVWPFCVAPPLVLAQRRHY